jgi:hypothetical protein
MKMWILPAVIVLTFAWCKKTKKDWAVLTKKIADSSTTYVHSETICFAATTGESRIYYKGNPPVAMLVAIGNGRIIHE